jgi:hypothetical protein
MAFESKRLRVQLPCKKAGTLVEKEAEPEAARIECPRFVSPHAVDAIPLPMCTNFPTLDCRFDSPCGIVTKVDCGRTEVACRITDVCGRTEVRCWGPATFNCGITDACATGTQVCGAPTFDPDPERIVVDPDPESPDTVLLRPEDLGRFRRQLQAELERIEALEERRGEIEGQLKELESAEKALKKRSKRK